MGQTDLTPTPEAYIAMLKMIVRNSTNKDDRAWAVQELLKYQANGYVV